ncbi:MAG: class I SAM-dependent methyltransferase [Acidobacteriota bacterium]
MNVNALGYLVCPRCEGGLRVDGSPSEEIQIGVLGCTGCENRYQVQNGVPLLLDDPDLADGATSKLYSDIWKQYSKPSQQARKSRGYRAAATSHLELLQKASGWELAQGAIGIDAGCGSGSTTIEIAGRYPAIQFVGIDLSDGIMRWAGEASTRANVQLVRGDLLAPPLARNAFDFAFSFGVLHHTPDPESTFRRLLDRLRPGGRITIFLYKDFSDIPVKRWLLLQVNRLRSITTRLSPRTLRAIARCGAPFVFIGLTMPARALHRLGAERLGRHIPYGTFPGMSSIASSLEDRFGAPYEHRFNIGALQGWADRAGLVNSRVIDCLPYGFSGLVLAGEKARR